MCVEMSGLQGGNSSEENLLLCILHITSPSHPLSIHFNIPLLVILMPLKFPRPVRGIVPFNFYGSNIVCLLMQIQGWIHIPPVAWFHFVFLFHASSVVICCQARYLKNSWRLHRKLTLKGSFKTIFTCCSY